MNLPRSKKAIIWDWNGTLLNDIVVCIDCMNILLKQRNLPQLSLQKYKQIFTFPVKDYYEKAGFDFSSEPFEEPAIEFIKLYHVNLYRADLFESVKKSLAFFKKQGYRQSILSAMEHDSLIRSLKDHDILDYFDEVSGIDNHYAHSKLEIGKGLLEDIGIATGDLLLIGDSLHDLEVAGELGIDCVLVANGHQSKERLLEKTENVVDNLDQVTRLFD